MTGEKVAVVGGSVAGCAAALALWRTGNDVTVLERSADGLQDRGVGIGMLGDSRRELVDAGYLDAATPFLTVARRKWITQDGSSYGGRVVAVTDFGARTYNWGLLWRSLRDRVPAAVDYRSGHRVVSVVDGGDKVTVTLSDGSQERFDAVIGTDGYRSTVRAAMFPDTHPRYVGYLLWRGTLPASSLPGRPVPWAEDDLVYLVFPGGHLVMYLIPGPDGPAVNWAVYSAAPSGRWDDPTSLPPGAMPPELLDHLAVIGEKLPRHWREVIRATPVDKLLVQPIYEVMTPALATGRLALVGDAAAVARPHTGAGAVKAMQDAVALQTVLSEGKELTDALRLFDQRRGPVHRGMVALGRSLGKALVLDTPDWGRMSADGLAEWWRAVATQG
ncbi:FAD-dependent monooxygenase [Kutzneria sp. NPDC052558]|uniref:FAD-dependent monooxygenase n=1 Tax=Kutzneria sp. NPDC052558 TaxID=3364121 RepID=UPI0037C94DFF